MTDALFVFGRHWAPARVVLVTAASVGSAYATKRREVLGRFAALIRHHLDEAVVDGSIPPVDTGIAAYAWLRALNEVGLASLEGAPPALADAASALSALFLRSVGADGRAGV